MTKLKTRVVIMVGFIAILIIFSCSKDPCNSAGSNPEIREVSCIHELQYNTKVNTFVVFNVPDDQLTKTEQMLMLPKSEYFEYKICKKSDGSLKTEIKAIPEVATVPNYEPNTLGVPESLKWRMVKENGSVTVFDEKDQAIEIYTSTNNGTIDDLNKMKEYNLIPAAEYEQLVQILKLKLNIQDYSQDIFIVTNIVDGLKTKTYIDKRYQKETVVESYDANDVIQFKTSYVYSVNDNNARMTNEIFETYKKSIDSNKIMTIVELTEYIYN